MKRISRESIRSGIGSELITIALLLLGVLFYVITLYVTGLNQASIQAQVIADIVNDGAVTYAQNNMNVSEDAYKAMANKIFTANQSLASQKNWYTIDSLTISDPDIAANHDSLFSPAEMDILENRGEIKSGVLRTKWYDFFHTGRFSGQSEIQALYDENNLYYNVKYKGPKYLDQIMKLTVSSSFNILGTGTKAKRTAGSTVFTTAIVPYNSRADKRANTTINGYFKELENAAYAGVLMGDSSSAEGNGIPKYGSIQQNVLLEARRYLGGGYDVASTACWPAVNWKGTSNTAYTPSGSGKNSYNHCYSFVDACFKYGTTGGLTGALSKYKHSYITRRVEYVNVVSAKTIWEEMQPTVNESVVYYQKLSSMTDMFRKLGLIYKFKNKGLTAPWDIKNNTLYYAYNYDIKSRTLVEGETVSGGNGKLVISSSTGGMTLSEAIAKYCGAGATQIFQLSDAEEWNVNKLQPGDVLIFKDANWRPRVADMLIALSNMTEPDDAVFANYDSTDQSFISHYALYVGNGRLVHSANISTYSSDPASQGVHCATVKGIDIEPGSTYALASVLRFTDGGSNASVELEAPQY